jgi:hypothetical protein
MLNEAPDILAAWAARVNAETRACMGVSVRPLFPSEAPGLTFAQRVELALAEAHEILCAADL